MASTTPTLLYHYCSASVFLNIIEDKKLHVSDLNFANDYAELSWGFELIKKISRKETEEHPEKKSIYEAVLMDLHLNLWQSTMIFCLSEEKDLLSQWRGYGGNGRGFAIGFDLDKLRSAFKLRDISVATINRENSFSLGKVVYDENEQKTRVIEALNASNDDNVLKLAHLCRLFKNSAFYEEKEWRIIHIPMELYIDNLSFKEANDKIVPYTTIAFKEYEDIIREVVVGPANPNGVAEKNLETLRVLLKKNGLANVELTRSKATYKCW